MIEMLTPLHTATCKHCGNAITMLRGEWRGADWYHDANGALTCPGAPTAWPIEDTIRDSEKPLSRPGITSGPTDARRPPPHRSRRPRPHVRRLVARRLRHPTGAAVNELTEATVEHTPPAHPRDHETGASA